MRLIVEIAADEDLEPGLQDSFGIVAEDKVFGIPPPELRTGAAGPKAVSRCMEAMQSVRVMLQNMTEKAAARNLLQQAALVRGPENQETFDFSRTSLVEQHECLAAILHAAVEKRHATVNDFQDFLQALRKVDKYDHFLGMMRHALGFYCRETLLIHFSSFVPGSRCLHLGLRFHGGGGRSPTSAPAQPCCLQTNR